jgi:hypothetical protein
MVSKIVSTESRWTVDVGVWDRQYMYFSSGWKHIIDKKCRKALDTGARKTEYVTNIFHLMVLCVWKKNAFKQNTGDIDQYEELWKWKEVCRSCSCQRKQFVLLKQAFFRFKELEVWYLTYYHQKLHNPMSLEFFSSSYLNWFPKHKVYKQKLKGRFVYIKFTEAYMERWGLAHFIFDHHIRDV